MTYTYPTAGDLLASPGNDAPVWKDAGRDMPTQAFSPQGSQSPLRRRVESLSGMSTPLPPGAAAPRLGFELDGASQQRLLNLDGRL
jgi:hypothetical protein